MNFLFPLGLAWLASVPVLVWLWRYATSKHQIRVSSLVPFAHLLRRRPARRQRVVVNWLFWLQAACLVLIALALAEPAFRGHATRTVLLILDTSASLQATHRGSPLLSAAKARLLSRIAHLGSRERALLVTTAPVRALTPEPTGDRFALQQLVGAASASDLGGRLSSAARLGQVLLGAAPDETVAATDEPAPEALAPSVRVESVGEPLPNVAILGVDAYEPLCVPAPVGGASPDQARLIVTIQNFSGEAQEVSVEARQRGRVLTQQRLRLEADQRLPVALSVAVEQAETLPVPAPVEPRPSGSGRNAGRGGRPASALMAFAPQEPVQVQVSAPHDALAVDNQAWVTLQDRARLSVVVASDAPSFAETIGRWLDACPRIQWRRLDLRSGPAAAAERPPRSALRSALMAVAAESASEVLITDQLSQAQAWPSSSLVFAGHTARAQAAMVYWLNVAPHAITTYLRSLEPVATAVTPLATLESGEPVLWALAKGTRVPLVLAGQRQGRRLVQCAIDPTATPSSFSLIVLFFNSVRWLSGSQGLLMTGEPLVVGPLPAGPVRIERPDGTRERRMHEGGVLREDATDRAGLYRVAQGGARFERAVNFFDAVESNTYARRSTWAVEEATDSAAPSSRPQRVPSLGVLPSPMLGIPRRAPRGAAEGRDGTSSRTERVPLAHQVISAVLALLVIEWLLYVRRGRT